MNACHLLVRGCQTGVAALLLFLGGCSGEVPKGSAELNLTWDDGSTEKVVIRDRATWLSFNEFNGLSQPTVSYPVHDGGEEYASPEFWHDVQPTQPGSYAIGTGAFFREGSSWSGPGTVHMDSVRFDKGKVPYPWEHTGRVRLSSLTGTLGTITSLDADVHFYGAAGGIIVEGFPFLDQEPGISFAVTTSAPGALPLCPEALAAAFVPKDTVTLGKDYVLEGIEGLKCGRYQENWYCGGDVQDVSADGCQWQGAAEYKNVFAERFLLLEINGGGDCGDDEALEQCRSVLVFTEQ